MLPLLTALCSASTSADIDEEALKNIGENGKVGLWETGGSAVAQENSILLIPPVQYRKGCVWTDAEIPSISAWQMSLIFNAEHVSGGNFGVWFISEYAKEGTFCGGPNAFSGLMLYGSIVPSKDHSNKINLAIIQSSGRSNHEDKNIPIDASIVTQAHSKIEITLRFDNGVLNVIHENNVIIKKKITVDLKENYIGISAQNGHLPMKLELERILFDLNVEATTSSKRKRSMGSKKTHSHFTPSTIYRLRNPAFNKTIEEIIKQEKSGGKITGTMSVDDLFDIIDEVNAANFDVASFSELNDFIRTNILNYSQKWQRRTLKLVDRVRNTRNVAGAALNYTTKMMETFKEQMQTTIMKTNDKMIDMYAIFNEIGARGIDVNDDMHQMADDINNRSIVTWLSYAAIAEVICIILLLVAANTCMKDRVYGRSLNNYM